jgi:predicted RNA-binding Zn-ribbon protein involved in translation (DUF1610 family)
LCDFIKPMTAATNILFDLSCTNCGYSLRTLEADSVCPECGRAVAESIEALRRRAARFGPPLRAHSAAWLRTAGIGLLLFLAGGAMRLLVDRMILPPAYWVMLAVSDAVCIIGVLLWTIPPMQPKVRGEVLRWLARIALTAWFIAEVGFYIGQRTSPHFGGNALAWFNLWCTAVGTALGLFYLGHLAGRMRRLLVHRVFLVLAIVSMLMIVGLIQLSRGGMHRPDLFGVTLPWPSFPIIGQAEEVLLIRRGFADVAMGRATLQQFIGKLGLVSAWCIASSSAMLWYGMILIGIASRRAEREAMERNT